MLSFVLGIFSAAFLTAFFCTPIIRRFAPALGLIDHPGHRKVHVQPTPMGGGIAVFLGIVIPAIIVLLVPGTERWASELADLRASVLEEGPVRHQILGIGLGGLILFLTGLVDDRMNLPWKLRLGIQLMVAIGVTWSGVRATVFVAQPWIGFVITVMWIIVLTNAMNFLDNMDGLSAGIGVVASLTSAVILLGMVSQPHWAVIFGLLLLSGSLGGFLCWNKPPASIFMGDSGSNLIGFLLATLTIGGTFYESTGSRHVILAPLCILAIPLYDFVTVILIRLKNGRSPFHGDKSHFSHRLVELGLRPSRAVLTIHLATLMTGLGGLLLYKVEDWTGAWLILALICCVLLLVSILETVGRRSLVQVALAERPESHDSTATSTPAEDSRQASHKMTSESV